MLMKLSLIGKEICIPVMKSATNCIYKINTHTIYFPRASHEQNNILAHKFHF
jgi:hypothetical protein